jgi:hypothetical protein
MKKFLQLAILCSVAFVTINASAGGNDNGDEARKCPDSGSTMVLLAAALGGLALVRRK